MYIKKLFSEYDFGEIRDSIILLDVDGTLGPHDLISVSESVSKQITAFSKNGNLIYIMSNNKDRERNKKLAEELHIEYLETKHRKPNVRVIESVRHLFGKKPIVVIGDKILTDGLFARRIKATFIHVKREKSPFDPKLVKFQYLLDWMVEKVIIF